MKSIGALDFGTIIAYLLPGFLGFYGLRYISTTIDNLIKLSYSKDGGIGVEISVILFSLSAGVIISAVRTIILDLLQEKTGVVKPSLDYSKLSDVNVLNAYEAAISNTYRFAQFYGNMFVAILFLFCAKFYTLSNLLESWKIIIVVVITLVILFIAHRSQISATYSTLEKILS